MDANPDPALPPKLTVHEPAEISIWSIVIEAAPDPLLVPRVLQKLAVPDIKLLALNFSRGPVVSHVRLEVQCPAARAELSVGKLRKVVAVRAVSLEMG